MRYGDEDRESENVEDRRSERGPMFRFPRGFPGGAEGTRIQVPIGGGGVSLSGGALFFPVRFVIRIGRGLGISSNPLGPCFLQASNY